MESHQADYELSSQVEEDSLSKDDLPTATNYGCLAHLSRADNIHREAWKSL